jgi:hypothetical protein
MGLEACHLSVFLHVDLHSGESWHYGTKATRIGSIADRRTLITETVLTCLLESELALI